MTVEMAARRNDERFRSLVLATSSVVWTTDAQGRVAEPLPSWSEFTGQSFEQYRGFGWLDAVHPEDRDHAKSIWAGAVKSVKLYEVEYRLRHRDGSWRNMIARGAPIRDGRGQLREWIGNCVDISDRVRVEQALREELRITDILHSMGLALAAELDLAKLIQLATDAATSVTRATFGAFFYRVNDAQGERLTLSCVSGVAPDPLAAFPMSLPAGVFGPPFLNESVVRSDDVTRDPRYDRVEPCKGSPPEHQPVRSYMSVPVVSRSSEVIGGLVFGHPDAGVFTLRDERIVRGIAAQASVAIDNARLVQDLRDAKRTLGRQLEFTRNITQNMGEGLCAIDDRGRVTFVNPAGEAMLDWTAAELMGREMHEVIHYRHADGSDFPAHTCPLMSVLTTGQPVRNDDDLFIRRDGAAFPVSYVSSPTFEGERVVGAVVAFHDMTQRKWAEEALRRSKEQLEQLVGERTAELQVAIAQLQASNRELQDFASVASHDLQEPLRKIQAFGDRLEARASSTLGAEGQDYLRRMRNAAGRMRTLISDLLQFSRVTTGAQPFSAVDLAEVAAEVVADLETAVERSGGRVDVGYLPTIEADRTQMRQLLQNLIGNALKFHAPHVPPVVRISSETDGEARVCRILCRDNGIGFDEKYLDRIFNVFQRLHARGAYEGTGIGLAVCRKIAERHGGSITARSTPGGGSTFVVTLPLRQPGGPAEENNA